jgi:thymidylate synthase (FAD)
MNVTLLSHQPDALELLLYTKNTRLRGGVTLADIKAWPAEKKAEHLAYMLDTIQSSWEFAWYVFEISGVSRAFTHQFVRTRTGSYAQESQRTVDVRDASFVAPASDGTSLYEDIIRDSLDGYAMLIDSGMPVQDARGVLPTNICTSIIAGFNLRTLHDMAEKRLCTRTQGEYQDVFRAMRERVIEVHPWAEPFLQVYCINHGTCCFPRYTECPVQKYTLTGVEQNTAKTRVKIEFESLRHEAVPVAKDGRTM